MHAKVLLTREKSRPHYVIHGGQKANTETKMIECCNVCEWQVNAVGGAFGGSKTYYGLDRIEIDTRRILIYYLLRLRSAFLIWHFRFKPAVNYLFITHGFAGKSAEFLTNYIDINLFYRGGLMARIIRRHI